MIIDSVPSQRSPPIDKPSRSQLSNNGKYHINEVAFDYEVLYCLSHFVSINIGQSICVSLDNVIYTDAPVCMSEPVEMMFETIR